MTTISIEGGCSSTPHVYNHTTIYTYRYSDNLGNHEINFTSSVVPKVGDEIVNGVHVPRVGYKINNDPGMQANKFD